MLYLYTFLSINFPKELVTTHKLNAFFFAFCSLLFCNKNGCCPSEGVVILLLHRHTKFFFTVGFTFFSKKFIIWKLCRYFLIEKFEFNWLPDEYLTGEWRVTLSVHSRSQSGTEIQNFTELLYTQKIPTHSQTYHKQHMKNVAKHFNAVHCLQTMMTREQETKETILLHWQSE